MDHYRKGFISHVADFSAESDGFLPASTKEARVVLLAKTLTGL